jgi:hypothetical protein
MSCAFDSAKKQAKMSFWLNEWEAMVACMVLGVLVPFILASRQPLDTTSSGKRSNKTLVYVAIIVHFFFYCDSNP